MRRKERAQSTTHCDTVFLYVYPGFIKNLATPNFSYTDRAKTPTEKEVQFSINSTWNAIYSAKIVKCFMNK
jgi:hypothetical protein